MATLNNDPKRLVTLVENMAKNNGINGLPRSFAFSNVGNKLYFLADTTSDGAEIHYVPISDEHTATPLEWKPLLGHKEQTQANVKLSKEEVLRRERMRAGHGLNSFTYHTKTGKIFVPASSWFVYDTESSSKNQRIELESPTAGARIDPKFSLDARLVSFVRNNDLWVQSVEKQQETQMTFTNLKNSDSGVGKFASGVAEYVMQEEFDRYTGYWWSPQLDQYLQKILYVNIDETKVSTYNIPTTGYRGEVDEFVYPLAGDDNAKFSLSIAELDTRNTNKLQVVLKHLNPSLKTRFPWCEYIPRLGWTPRGDKIWVQLLDRKQQRYALITIDINEFKLGETVEADDLWTNQSDDNIANKDIIGAAENGDKSIVNFNELMSGINVLHEETTNLWINITDVLHWYTDGSDRVVIASELLNPKDTNKMRHLYMLTPVNGVYQQNAITSGDYWQVEASSIMVDEKRELLYFMGTKDSPLENHLYVASTLSANAPEPSKNAFRLTPAGCTHLVDMNEDKSLFVTCYSNVKEPHRVQLFSLNYQLDSHGHSSFPPSASLHSTLAKPIAQPKPTFDVTAPELFNFKNSLGETIYGCYFKPKNFDPSQKYPTILKVYGGPHVQYVSNSYKLTRLWLNLQLYTHLGYLVVMIDGVGSWRRGLKFEGYLRNCMGTKEVQEQVEGLTHLIKSGIVDPERIAVTGWSYGGYLAFLCLAQRPDFFKLAVSGAPVSKWEAYDTAYTERYMDTPSNNPTGYANGSVLKYVPTLPDEPNRLLFIHGALDENVHLCHTLELIQELITHGKPYQLQIFPKERHGVRDRASAKYNELSVLRFFTSNL